MKEMDENVAVMKGWLMRQVGVDWNSATAANVSTKLDLGRVGVTPWDEVRNVMTQDGKDSVPNHVARSVRGLTDTFFAFKD